MDESTEGVTLFAGFLFDVVGEYRGRYVFSHLSEIVAAYSEDRPDEQAPITLYNELCDWVETNVGRATLQIAGQSIGNRVYAQIVADGSLGEQPSPSRILHALKHAASMMIQDPKGRGWEILKDEQGHILMRRTQTFNCMLQEGLLRSLVERTGARSPTVGHVKCTRRGDEFCDYDLRWRE